MALPGAGEGKRTAGCRGQRTRTKTLDRQNVKTAYNLEFYLKEKSKYGWWGWDGLCLLPRPPLLAVGWNLRFPPLRMGWLMHGKGLQYRPKGWEVFARPWIGIFLWIIRQISIWICDSLKERCGTWERRCRKRSSKRRLRTNYIESSLVRSALENWHYSHFRRLYVTVTCERTKRARARLPNTKRYIVHRLLCHWKFSSQPFFFFPCRHYDKTFPRQGECLESRIYVKSRTPSTPPGENSFFPFS